MNVHTVQTIVLHRTNYSEADRIITALTHEGEKMSFIAKGVRKPKSKLVAGTELFCVAEVCYVQGKGTLATMTSARIISQHSKFLSDLRKVNLCYDLLGYTHKHTQETANSDYFALLRDVLHTLEEDIAIDIIALWAWSRILRQSGQGIRLDAQSNGAPFIDKIRYGFDMDRAGFIAKESGRFEAAHVKLLRLLAEAQTQTAQRVKNASDYAADLLPIVKQFVEVTTH